MKRFRYTFEATCSGSVEAKTNEEAHAKVAGVFAGAGEVAASAVCSTHSEKPDTFDFTAVVQGEVFADNDDEAATLADDLIPKGLADGEVTINCEGTTRDYVIEEDDERRD